MQGGYGQGEREIERNQMKIYLAARYSRREELCGYRTQLEALGHTVTGRWLNGNHQIDDQGLSVEAKRSERERFATEDRDDVLAAEMLIAFTEEPRSSNSRGGRHVELGIALGRGMRVAIVGPRENVFCCLPEVEHYEQWYGIGGGLFRITGHSFCGAPCGACGDIEGCHKWKYATGYYGSLVAQHERTGRA